jgi:hypothetical protein
MKEIELDHPVVSATIFYLEEYKSIIIRQETRKGFNDIILTIDQLFELTVALRNELEKANEKR